MQRWQGDSIGHGIGDGRLLVEAVQRLIAAMESKDWIAESPDEHILPHIRNAAGHGASPWRLLAAKADGDRYTIDLEWTRPNPRMIQLTIDAFTLAGTIAETNTHLRQQVGADSVDLDITTGTLDSDGPYKGHGHLLRLHITGPAVEAILRRQPP